ncbi:hypothetical protein L1987_36599 [Smallanthus sonchifolius]|uniref:Uncharacterized protein n=1 Tax=Smallanthus sonchifolius TaxID=185202 RepID=A0ACB9HFE8_9ASTR|nr:hypothetical protein L1987_36599 [Smallanthus sonchifolius]
MYGGVKRKRLTSELNWTKRSIFFELDYWSSLLLKHNLDVMHVEKNVCESLLGTLLMNDKSKDTHKAHKDLENMGIRHNLWLTQKNNKLYQPQAPYSFTPSDRERFCQFIRGVRLPDGFGSNFKNKVLPNNSNIIGLKSHDYHILMQRLLPIGVRSGLHKNVSTTINDVCTFFQKICARSVDVKDMYEANEEVVKILCNLEMIYPPTFFDIMVHLILHLPEEAILGGPVYMRWMYPFERYMKKLKAYRNKAKPEGSIVEGYVADEALTFCYMYLDGMQTKFNRPDRNADAGIPKRQFQVFSSQCRPISKKKIKALSEHANKSLQWFVLNNCDEIKAYKSEFESKFPERNMQTDFSSRLKYEANVFSSSSSSSTPDNKELRALAHGPLYASSYTACIVNGVRFVVQNRDSRRTTQNSGVVTIGEDDTPFYGQLEEIIELNYIDGYSVVLFHCKWFDTRGKRLIKQNNTTIIDIGRDWYVSKEWVVEDVHHRKLWDHPTVVNEINILHDTQSNDYTLVIDTGCEGGESSHVGYLPMRTTLNEGGDPIHVASIDLDESFINDDEEDEEDAYNLDDEDELNDDDEEDDDVVDTRYFRKMATMAQSHGGDGGDGGPYHFNSGCATGSGGSSSQKRRCKGKNLKLYKKFEQNGRKPLPIDVELHAGGYKFVGPNATDFIRAISLEVEKVVPPYYPNWAKVPIEKKRAVYPTLIDRIQEEYTRSSAESGGDSSAVDEIACMERALGHRRGHIRGVGRVVSNPTPDLFSTLLHNHIGKKWMSVYAGEF